MAASLTHLAGGGNPAGSTVVNDGVGIGIGIFDSNFLNFAWIFRRFWGVLGVRCDGADADESKQKTIVMDGCSRWRPLTVDCWPLTG